MPASPDNIPEWTLWGALAAGCGFVLKYFSQHIKPREWLAYANEPTMRPVNKRIDGIQESITDLHGDIRYVRRVIDKLPGATEAHAAVKAEDARASFNWDT